MQQRLQTQAVQDQNQPDPDERNGEAVASIDVHSHCIPICTVVIFIVNFLTTTGGGAGQHDRAGFPGPSVSD